MSSFQGLIAENAPRAQAFLSKVSKNHCIVRAVASACRLDVRGTGKIDVDAAEMARMGRSCPTKACAKVGLRPAAKGSQDWTRHPHSARWERPRKASRKTTGSRISDSDSSRNFTLQRLWT